MAGGRSQGGAHVQAMLLEADVEQFWREGWILVRQLAPPRAVAAVLEAGQELTDADGEAK